MTPMESKEDERISTLKSVDSAEMRRPRAKTLPNALETTADPSKIEKTTANHVKQAFKAIGKFSANTNKQVNKAFQRPVDSLHSIGEAVKKNRASKSPSRRKTGYTSLPSHSHQPFRRHHLADGEPTVHSVPSHDTLEEQEADDESLIGNEVQVTQKTAQTNAPLHSAVLTEPSMCAIQGGPCLGNDSFRLPDSYIFWTVIFATLSLQLYENWEEILHNHFTFGTVVGCMMLAFAVGLEIDQEVFWEEIKVHFFGIDMVKHKEATWENSNRLYFEQEHRLLEQQDGNRKTKVPFFKRIFWKRSVRRKAAKSKHKSFTTLNKELSTVRVLPRKEENAAKNKDLMQQLAQFCSKKPRKGSKKSQPSRVEEPTKQLDGSQFSQTSLDSTISMGETALDDARAVDLMAEVSTPLCSIRGLDLFRTNDADPDMITHPFLLQHGLRSYPTFIINILTQYGNILVYFKLPDWLKDWDKSLVENDDDPSDVIALKRFLKSEDNYKTKCLKVMPELVDGPLPVRLLAPHNRAFPLNFEGFLSASYAQEPPTKDYCPAMCLTLDLVSNGTIRSMVGIFKRNMHRMTVDFACIIDPDEDGEPSCVLGLWRMDHLEADHYPELPDRYDNGDGEMEKADSIRGSIIVKRLSEAFSSKESSLFLAVVETSESL